MLQRFGIKRQPAEVACVFKNKSLATEIENSRSVFRERSFRGNQVHATRHSQMPEQCARVAILQAEIKHEILRAPFESENRCASHSFHNFINRRRPSYARTIDADVA